MKTETDSFYDDPVLVPAKWYDRVCSYQTVHGSGLLDCAPGDRPVVMRGSLHCRMAKRGGARQYGTDVLMRYIRRLRITQVDAGEWHDWVCHDLVPLAATRRWWPLQRACVGDILALVSPYHVVLNGGAIFVRNGEAYRNVKRLARALDTLSRFEDGRKR